MVKGDERLVLLFNEGGSMLNIELTNKDVKPGQKATIWGTPGKIATSTSMKVTIPPDDVTLVHIK